jgi:hypothetical protein
MNQFDHHMSRNGFDVEDIEAEIALAAALQLEAEGGVDCSDLRNPLSEVICRDLMADLIRLEKNPESTTGLALHYIRDSIARIHDAELEPIIREIREDLAETRE